MYKNQESRIDYLSYLLRLWCARDGEGRRVWRATAQMPGTSVSHTFSDLEALIAFLREQTREPEQVDA